MQDKKKGELKRCVFIFVSMLILVFTLVPVSAERLPTVGGDSGNWGTILNSYLNKLAGANATQLNTTMVNGTNIYFSAINTTHILNGTIIDADISDTTNLTLGEKITFTLGEIIDNIVDGWITITGGLNVTNNLEVNGSVTFSGGNFSVNNSDLFVDISKGRVGIGTTNPGTELEVVGDITSTGTSWTSRTSASDNNWRDVTYGNGLFVAVADTGTNDMVMTSPDGITWTTRTSVSNSQSVTYAQGMFVSVGDNIVMTSLDGINWTSRTSAANSYWWDVVYGNGLFVAVARTGTSKVMTSPDGITWTSRTSASQNNWVAITYGNGLFVAVSDIKQSASSDYGIMTSPDGITWTNRTVASLTYGGVTYGNGLFVAVANSGTGNRVVTSPDGITWTSRTSATDNDWMSVIYGNGLFVAVSETGSSDRVMTSPDGITWTSRTSAADYTWESVTYGNGVFVAVGDSGIGDRVMTSGKTEFNEIPHNNIYQGGMEIRGNLNVTGMSYLGNIIINADNITTNNIIPKDGGNVTIDGNLTLTDKITFTLGEIIDNIVNGWITITGNLNVTNNITANYFIGNGSQLTDVVSSIGANSIDGTQLSDTITLDSAMNIIANDFSVNNTDLFVDVSTGRVGIGTSSPSAQLELKATNAIFNMESTSTGVDKSVILRFTQDVGPMWGIGVDTIGGNSNNFDIWDQTSGSIVMTIENGTGNVGIATTTPSSKLNVVGNINVTGDIYTDKWQDYSGTSTIIGWSSYTTKLIYYKKIGDIVYVQYNIDGTSNSTSTWFSLPYTQSNIVGLSMNSQVRAMDNTAWVTAGIVTMAPNSANVEFWTNSGAAGWVSSGQKVIIGQFWYRV